MKNLTVKFGLGFMAGMTAITYWTFYTALLHGYDVLVQINEYHEAWIEAVALTIVAPVILYAFIKLMKKLYSE